MEKRSLIDRLKRTVYTGLAGVGALSYVAGCGDGNIGPQIKPTPEISQSATLQNFVDISYNATLKNVDSATVKILRDGTLASTKTIKNQNYTEMLSGNSKGEYTVILEAPGAKPDTTKLTVPNYNPDLDLTGLQTNFDDKSQLNVDLTSRLSDKNPEDRPVSVTSVKSLDGRTQPTINGYQLTLDPVKDSLGLYQVEIKANSKDGGLVTKILSGQVTTAPEQIVFARYTGGTNEDIYTGDLVNNALTNVKRLTTDAAQDFNPVYSPDGKEILWTNTRTGKFAVWKMNADGTSQRDITSNSVERAMEPAWCSNGKIVITYRNKNDTEAGIGIINSDGTSFTPVYAEPLTGTPPGWPRWSPNCSEIVFQKYANNNWEIFTINSDGSSLRNVTNNSNIDQQPSFLPNGSILFWSDRANPGKSPIDADLWLTDSTKSNPARLTNDSGRELDPAVSSDGKYVVFTRFRFFGDPSQLYMTKISEALDATKWTQLTNGEPNLYASFRPK